MLSPLELALVAFLQAGHQAPSFPEVEVPSEDGRYVARIGKVAGHERLADALARWKLTMLDGETGEELWSTLYPHSADTARYFTASDGSTFVRLNERFSEGRPVVRMDRFGERTVERTGREFELERNDVVRTDAGSLWLIEEGDSVEFGWVDTLHGPALMLTLESSRGWRRELDVSMGVILPEFDFGAPVAYPGFPDGTGPSEALEVPYVTTVRVPPVALATLPLRIEVTGNHATPNWQFFAFRLVEEDEGRFVLTPYSRPPAADAVVPQVLEGFHVAAILQGLQPGHYEVAVSGRGGAGDFQPVEVLPGRTHVRLEVSGGLVGVHDTIEVFQPGILRVTRSHAESPAHPRHLSPDERARFVELVAALPEEPRSRASTIGSDFLRYRLGWWTGAEWRELAVDDGTLEGPVRALVEFLSRS